MHNIARRHQATRREVGAWQWGKKMGGWGVGGWGRRICRGVSVHNVDWLDVLGGKTNTEVYFNVEVCWILV